MNPLKASKVTQDGEIISKKLSDKINTRLRTFTSQISNLPGPKNHTLSTMAEDLGKERRDHLVMKADDKFRLRHELYLGSTY
jgi:hypothetical protein